MKIRLFYPFIFGVSTLLNAEPSAFNAGDINANNPYGLTQSEKVLLENKKNTDKLKIDLLNLQNRLLQTEEQIDGMRSVLDGTNAKVLEIHSRLNGVEEEGINDANLTSSQLADLQEYVKKTRQIQANNNAKVKKALKELGAIIDSINANYVPKAKFDELEARVAKLEGKELPPKLEGKKEEQKPSKKAITDTKLSSKQIFEEANKLYHAKKYKQASEHFALLIANNYRPAYANYMLGEINYAQNHWIEALAFYEKSVALYKKAPYMPHLLYHVAICYDKLDQPNDANKFYEVLRSNYPESKEAKASPKRK